MNNIHSISKLNIINVLKSPSYLFMLIITGVLPCNSMVQLADKSSQSYVFIPVYVFIALNISVFLLLNMITISMIVITEKSSGRCEYYLANQMNVHFLTRKMSSSSYFLSVTPILMFNLIMIGYAFTTHNSVLTELVLNVRFALFFVTFLMFTYTATYTLTYLSMLSKSPERIRTYLSVISFLFAFISVFPGMMMKKIGMNPSADSILLITASTLLVLALICALTYSYLKRRLTSEAVILSYKQ